MNPRLFEIEGHCFTLNGSIPTNESKKATVYRKEIWKFYLARHQAKALNLLLMKTKVAYADKFFSPVSDVDLSVSWIRIRLMQMRIRIITLVRIRILIFI